MANTFQPFEVYLEVGSTRTFAVVPVWPGWSRSGRDEQTALQTLFDYGPRYARAVGTAGLGFRAPQALADLVVDERLPGNAATDFGAPNVDLPGDTDPVDVAELQRCQNILRACWQAFDIAVKAAEGKTLRTGPRGGGRDLGKIVAHVREVDAAYLRSLGGKIKFSDDMSPDAALALVRTALLETLEAAVRGEIPTHGPRGGKRWTPRYFVRRLAWHELDHAWEIEDRAE